MFNYTFIKKSCLAIVFASQNLCHYILTHKVKLISKIDPLKYLLNKTTLIDRLAKWLMILSEFDIEYVNKKLIKGQSIANQLEYVLIKRSNLIVADFLDMHIL